MNDKAVVEYMAVDTVNVINKKREDMATGILNEALIAKMNCLPRPEPVSLAGRETLKTPWDFYKSIFKTYKPDN